MTGNADVLKPDISIVDDKNSEMSCAGTGCRVQPGPAVQRHDVNRARRPAWVRRSASPMSAEPFPSWPKGSRRPRARLLRLPVMVPMLCALPLCAAGRAEAQGTPVWSATLTPAEVPGGIGWLLKI